MSFVATAPAAPNPWVRILGALEKKINRQSFDTWLKPTRFSHVNGRMLFVRVPTPEFQHIGDRYGDLIQEAMDVCSTWSSTTSLSSPRRKIRPASACARMEGSRRCPPIRRTRHRTVIRPDIKTGPITAKGTRYGPQRPRNRRGSTGPPPRSSIRRYTFDAFVIGNGNQFARAAAERGRRAALEGLQSALSLRRRRHGQDPLDARHRSRGEAPRSRNAPSATSPARSSPTR